MEDCELYATVYVAHTVAMQWRGGLIAEQRVS